MRAINHYRLDGDDPSILASGRTVFDLGLVRQIRRGVEFNLSLAPLAPAVARIHGTPGYPLTVAAGLTFRMGGK